MFVSRTKIISRVLPGKLNSHSVLILKTAPHKSSLTDLSTFIQDRRTTSMCLNLKSFPKYLRTRLFTRPSHFPGSSGYRQHLTPKAWRSQMDTDRVWICSHKCNLSILVLRSRGASPTAGNSQNISLQSVKWVPPALFGQDRGSEGPLLHLHLVPRTAGLWVQLDPLNASTTQVRTIASSSLSNVFLQITASAICTSLHLCCTCPQKCFDLLFVRPLDKYIIHQHNHPIIIQLRRSLCQLVLCVNDPFQKNRLPGFLWVPSLPA